jgi:hypothetical protein
VRPRGARVVRQLEPAHQQRERGLDHDAQRLLYEHRLRAPQAERIQRRRVRRDLLHLSFFFPFSFFFLLFSFFLWCAFPFLFSSFLFFFWYASPFPFFLFFFFPFFLFSFFSFSFFPFFLFFFLAFLCFVVLLFCCFVWPSVVTCF